QGKAVAAIVGGADPEWQLGRLYRVHEDLPDEARIVRDQHADGLLHGYSLRLPRVTLHGSPTGSHGSGSGILISESKNACDNSIQVVRNALLERLPRARPPKRPI